MEGEENLIKLSRLEYFYFLEEIEHIFQKKIP